MANGRLPMRKSETRSTLYYLQYVHIRFFFRTVIISSSSSYIHHPGSGYNNRIVGLCLELARNLYGHSGKHTHTHNLICIQIRYIYGKTLAVAMVSPSRPSIHEESEHTYYLLIIIFFFTYNYLRLQDKIALELNQVFGDSERPVTFDDLQKLNYLEQVIKETWRMYPPIPFIGRKSTADFKLGKSQKTRPKNNLFAHLWCGGLKERNVRNVTFFYKEIFTSKLY